jgi:small subunit ribosomal protein S12
MLKSHVWIKNPRYGQKFRSARCPALNNCPFKKGIISKIRIMTPRKPNSARRRVARLRTGKKNSKKLYFAYIQGKGYTLIEYSLLFIRGGRTNDLPGLKYKLVRGKYNFRPPYRKTKKISKYTIYKYKFMHFFIHNNKKPFLYSPMSIFITSFLFERPHSNCATWTKTFLHSCEFFFVCLILTLILSYVFQMVGLVLIWVI